MQILHSTSISHRMPLNVNYLKAHELKYEIEIRGEDSPSTVEEKRRLLRGLLAQEDNNRSFRDIKNEFDFDTDSEGIQQTLDELRPLVDHFSGSENDNDHKRLTTRLSHVAARLNRVNCDASSDDQVKKLKALSDLLIMLESDLAEKVAPLCAPHPSSSPIHSTARTCSVIKGVPVYKWGISKFSGRGCLITFLELVESLRISRGCSREDLFASAGDLFEGHAWTWWHNSYINNRFTSWIELVDALKQAFLRDNYDRSLLDEIRSRKQGFKEPITIYISSMEALFHRLTKRPDERDIVETIKENLLPEYTRLLALHDITSIEHLTRMCKKIENTLSGAPAPKFSQFSPGPSKSQTFSCPQRNTSTLSVDLICWNCKQSGHPYYRCQVPRSLFCFGCGRQGITKARCGPCSKNATGSGNIPSRAVAGLQSQARKTAEKPTKK